jgi:archaemetzincin
MESRQIKSRKSSKFHPALGSPLAISAGIRGLFHSQGFRSKRTPTPGEWLAQHDEDGQTLHDFVNSKPNRPTKSRHVIYLQPFGPWRDSPCPSLAALELYAEAFFERDVAILPSISLEDVTINERINPHDGQRQLLTTDILRLLARRLPDDAFCLLGMSMLDLYPDPNWNFVFGQASLRSRVGVYSFARYTTEGDAQLTLRRSMKVMAHEIGHMYGMTHCTFFECGLNGSNHLEEADRRPIYLCPVCLRKMHWNSEIDPLRRYYHLAEFYRNFDYVESANFMRERIRRAAN